MHLVGASQEFWLPYPGVSLKVYEAPVPEMFLPGPYRCTEIDKNRPLRKNGRVAKSLRDVGTRPVGSVKRCTQILEELGDLAAAAA